MRPRPQHNHGVAGGVWLALALTEAVCAQTTAPAAPTPAAVIVELRGQGVSVSRQPNVWDPARTNQALYPGNVLKTDDRSQALVRFSELETIRVAEHSSLRIGGQVGRKRGFEFLQGLLYFFHRDKPNEFEVQTPQVSAIIRGTEFTLEVAENGATILSLFDGEVALSNPFGQVDIHTGEQGIVEPGQAPRRTAMVEGSNIIQWCLYYPGVLNLDELNLGEEPRQTLAQSLAAYRQGDLVAALTVYPEDRQLASDEERVYLAALLLAFGDVHKAEQLLEPTRVRGPQGTPTRVLADALFILIAGVKSEPQAPPTDARSASSLLAESYLLQAQSRLAEALANARQATVLAPNFSFAWARVAELEFSFGRVRTARAALETALQLAPRNAQAHALHGFLLAAANHFPEARAAFEQAIAIDPALANAWLGRGLCRIHQGQADAGREDLQMATTVEPTRALLRSYLGKAFSNAGDRPRVARELDLAARLDPNDPTAWLYSALLHRDEHELNDAIADLERSVELNDNRQVYRSRLLLDEDRATRSASLAAIYRDAGLEEVSPREAARAVSADYANYSAHLFLANSFDSLRDPTRFNLRYETAWFNELLLANLLAPVAAGTFSQNISQQEYSRLFEVKRLGLSSTTELRSDGQYRELASQFGTFDRFSYSLDLDWQRNEGVRPNNELTRIEWYSQAKLQLSDQDSLFLLTKYQDYHSGDNFQYYDWRTSAIPNYASVRTNFNFDEFQTPTVVGAWHREWTPGVHTLLLGGRLINDQRLSDTPVPLLVVATNTNNETLARPSPFDVKYRSEFEIYTAELNQIMRLSSHTAVVGARFQTGQFDTRSTQVNLDFPAFFPNTKTTAVDDFQRIAVYGYDTFELMENLLLTGGLTYDQVRFPRNFRQVPISDGEETRHELGPKAATVWSPSPELTVRGVYSRSLGGVSFDESYRLEPVQLAGFSQAFRTLIPESVAGSVSAPRFETWGAALDLKLTSRTYLGLQGEWLNSEVDRSWGVYDFDSGSTATVIPQQLRFEERSTTISINQLLGSEWSLGAHYRFVRDDLRTRWPSLEPLVNPGLNNDQSSDLHRVGLMALFQHPSGFFAQAGADWFFQRNSLQTNDATGRAVKSELPDDEFPLVNLSAGFRFPRQRGEIAVGLLNVTGNNYHLNPLNAHAEGPHERVFFTRLTARF